MFAQLEALDETALAVLDKVEVVCKCNRDSRVAHKHTSVHMSLYTLTLERKPKHMRASNALEGSSSDTTMSLYESVTFSSRPQSLSVLSESHWSNPRTHDKNLVFSLEHSSEY